jgi:hypothetical protein
MSTNTLHKGDDDVDNDDDNNNNNNNNNKTPFFRWTGTYVTDQNAASIFKKEE